jgi:hypothetical protein
MLLSLPGHHDLSIAKVSGAGSVYRGGSASLDVPLKNALTFIANLVD